MVTEYDYVVIGGGAAGSIVAANAAAAGYSVLLLERGQPVAADNVDVWDPTRWIRVLEDPAFEIGIVSTPQAGLAGVGIPLLQSRGLGGCQIHNAMVYVRGGQPTYDSWANDHGCVGWDYATLLPYFEALEAQVGIASPTDPVSQSVLAAGQALNYGLNSQYNDSPTAWGTVPFQFTAATQADGSLRRTTAYQSFIGEAPPANLTIICGAYVRRLMFDTIGAVGVEYVLDGSNTSEVVMAGREAVLCAGAINTPALLLRSGIGPGAQLAACHIPVLVDQPNVGAHFRDDLGIGLSVPAQTPPPQPPSGYAAAGVFACSGGGPPPDPAGFGDVDLELQVGTTLMFGPYGPDNSPALTIGASAMHMKSSGTVSLDPIFPFDKAPLVDPNWLSEPEDMTKAVAALNLVQAMANEPGLVATWGLSPPAPIRDPEAYIREKGETVQHYVGSCRMGPDPATSVVDPSLRLHGLARVRVIDASVAPTTVTGNTAGVSMVIGARGSALLLGS